MYRTQSVLKTAGVAPAILPRARILSLLLPLGCLCFAILLGMPGAAYVPDSAQYRLLALGQRGAVPPPFSARILGPAIVGWLSRATGRGVDSGFLILGVLSLTVFIALTARYLWSSKAPFAIFAAVFLMPFWVDTFHDYYLPDLLHAVLLAAILTCLFHGYTAAGLLLLFPAYLARESTILVAFCLVLAGWRRMPLRTASLGLLAILAGGLVSAHYGHGGPPSVHELSGGVYLLGKLLWSFSRNVLALPLWSNTLPECNPIWATSLPRSSYFGAIRAVGVCQPSLWGPGRLLLAWFGVFGLGPAAALLYWRDMLSPRALGGKLWGSGYSADGIASPSAGAVLVLRFCIIYGLISILMTPLLGASADRLVEYGWPFYFVGLTWFLSKPLCRATSRAAGLVALHLLICWLAWFAFQQQTKGYVLGGLAALALNAWGYFLLRRNRDGYRTEGNRLP